MPSLTKANFKLCKQSLFLLFVHNIFCVRVPSRIDLFIYLFRSTKCLKHFEIREMLPFYCKSISEQRGYLPCVPAATMSLYSKEKMLERFHCFVQNHRARTGQYLSVCRHFKG